MVVTWQRLGFLSVMLCPLVMGELIIQHSRILHCREVSVLVDTSPLTSFTLRSCLQVWIHSHRVVWSTVHHFMSPCQCRTQQCACGGAVAQGTIVLTSPPLDMPTLLGTSVQSDSTFTWLTETSDTNTHKNYQLRTASTYKLRNSNLVKAELKAAAGYFMSWLVLSGLNIDVCRRQGRDDTVRCHRYDTIL